MNEMFILINGDSKEFATGKLQQFVNSMPLETKIFLESRTYDRKISKDQVKSSITIEKEKGGMYYIGVTNCRVDDINGFIESWVSRNYKEPIGYQVFDTLWCKFAFQDLRKSNELLNEFTRVHNKIHTNYICYKEEGMTLYDFIESLNATEKEHALHMLSISQVHGEINEILYLANPLLAYTEYFINGGLVKFSPTLFRLDSRFAGEPIKYIEANLDGNDESHMEEV